MIFLIFPNQLFYNNPLITKSDKIYLIEEPRYFTDFNFHKLKLAYHRATMKKYYSYLKKKKYSVQYIDFNKVNNHFYSSLGDTKFMNPIDHDLLDKLTKLLKSYVILDNLNFLLSPQEVTSYFKDKKKYTHDEFYKFQRKKLNILMNGDKPVGGKWSYDTLNRLSIPKKIKIPKVVSKVASNKYISEAKTYINKHFPDNYGSLDNFIYPIDDKGAKKWFMKFLKERLAKFGPYEDAVSTDEPFVYHSVISPMMNIGLLPDKEVVQISWDFYNKHKAKVPIQSFEGFIRQVIGWRNYVYSIYLVHGEKQSKMNFLKHHNKLSDKWWLGTTGLEPIDSLIKKINDFSYVHHIERLMYLGNILLLCKTDPKEVYRIFMEWTIDAYDWVMVPNVYGMSQYADGGSMMTRPYFSSSNYIVKMSNFKKDGSWDKIWDALYYNFIHDNYDLIRKNYATAQQALNWTRKSKKDKDEIIDIASKFISQVKKD